MYYGGCHFTSPAHDKTSTSSHLERVIGRNIWEAGKEHLLWCWREGWLAMFQPLWRKDVSSHSSAWSRLMGIGSHCTERHGEPAYVLLFFLELCALQELGVMRQLWNPPCNILANRDCIFSCPLLKWEYCGVCAGILGTTDQTWHISLKQGIIKESKRNLAGKSEHCFLY